MHRPARGGRAIDALAGFFAAISVAATAGVALGDNGTGAVRSAVIFSVTKSENRNQVTYAVRLDSTCRPIGGAPVFAYWRMFERSPSVEPLTSLEERVYGIGRQEVVDRGDERVVRIQLRAVSGREILVRAQRAGSGCSVSATTRIGVSMARLLSVHVHIAWPFGVSAIDIAGFVPPGEAVVRETLRP